MTEEIVDKKFNEWTKDLSPKKRRIKIFKQIRNLPYENVSKSMDYEEHLIEILTKNKGSCSPKHFLLGIMYEELSIPVKYTTYPFYWDALDVNYPSEIRKLAEKMPMRYHLACKAHIDGKYVLIDATWDIPLKKVGFPVNEEWNGFDDTLNAINPLEEIIHETAVERIEYVNTKNKNKDYQVCRKFHNEINNWFEKIRRVNII